jgi:hypothetical protein
MPSPISANLNGTTGAHRGADECNDADERITRRVVANAVFVVFANVDETIAFATRRDQSERIIDDCVLVAAALCRIDRGGSDWKMEQNADSME